MSLAARKSAWNRRDSTVGVHFAWSKQRESAAQMLADDRMSIAQIAEKLGISYQVIGKWQGNVVFAARVQEHVSKWKEKIHQRGLAIKERRIQAAIADYEATEIILQERGEENKAAAGGKTGFVTIREKMVGERLVQECAIDKDLFDVRQKLREQVAKEMGQWNDHVTLTGVDGGPVQINHTLEDPDNPFRTLRPETLVEVLKLLGTKEEPVETPAIDVSPAKEIAPEASLTFTNGVESPHA